ncbi:MAG: hypothetical protein OEW21_05885 [Betaproteobacteria bacterium]|nr:hypothetical protein [Betaproteobacteria bacterium]
MTIEGELFLHLAWDGARVRHARARCERPRAARLLPGRRAEEATTLIGQLYTLCGRAQTVAAAEALRAARNADESFANEAATAVLAETVHEHLWRLLIDWPKHRGGEPRVAVIARARQALAPFLNGDPQGNPASTAAELAALAADEVFAVEPSVWLALDDLAALAAWAREAGTPAASLLRAWLARKPASDHAAVALLPPRVDERMLAELNTALDRDPDFERTPHWRGEARETGVLARSARRPLVAACLAAWGCGVAARFVARLVDLGDALEALAGRREAPRRLGRCALGAGEGLAWVESARGLLVHRLRLAGDRIDDYRIVAPTEWNFHPAGAFVQGALAIAAETPRQLAEGAHQLAFSLDPCVAYRLEIGNA